MNNISDAIAGENFRCASVLKRTPEFNEWFLPLLQKRKQELADMILHCEMPETEREHLRQRYLEVSLILRAPDDTVAYGVREGQTNPNKP
ncbi:MAG: hypothetical protein QM680_13705 [Luteolibacter sp.]